MTETGNKNEQQELGWENGSAGSESENHSAAMGSGTVATTDKNRTAANKRPRNAAIWNKDFDRYAVAREEEENED